MNKNEEPLETDELSEMDKFLEAIRIYNALTQGHRNAEGYLIFKRGELIFSTNRSFEPLIPQIREKFPHIFNL